MNRNIRYDVEIFQIITAGSGVPITIDASGHASVVKNINILIFMCRNDILGDIISPLTFN